MNILIIGSGRIGRRIIKTLEIDKINMTVIDNDYDALVSVKKSKRVKTITGNIMEDEILRELEIEEFDYILVLTDSDKSNILISRKLKNLGGKYIIARLNSTEVIEELYSLKKSLGIDYIISPQLETARTLKQILDDEENYIRDAFGNGKIEVIVHQVEIGSEFNKVAIKDIGELTTILVVAISRDGKLIIPSGNTEIEEGDNLYLMGLKKDILKFKNIYFKLEEKKTVRNITILGSGGITKEFVKLMPNENIKVIVKKEVDLEKTRDEMPEVFVTKEKLSGAEIFKKEDIKDNDVFLALTDNDELNIALSLLANKTGVEKVMARVESLNYVGIFDELNFVALNPILITANKIVKMIRSNRGISIHLLFSGEAEVLEIKLKDELEIIGKTMEEANLPKGIIIGGIIRENGMAIVPRGKTKFQKGDIAVVFCMNKNREELIRFINPEEKRGLLSELFLYE